MRHTWAVFTNCTAGHEGDYEDWYLRIHIPDLLRIPGVRGAKLTKLSLAQTMMTESGIMLSDPAAIGATYRYLACYDMEADDIRGVLQEVINRAGTEQMVLSPYMTDVYTVMYEALDAPQAQ